MFGTNGVFKRALHAASDEPLSSRFLAAAALTGGVEAFVYTPLELIKARMQVAKAGAAGRMTPAMCAREIYREKGLTRGLFHGLRPTFIRETVGD